MSDVVKLLNEDISIAQVKTRKQNGNNLQYIEGATAEDNANRIFKFQWDKQKLKQEFLYKREYVNASNKEMIEVAYSAEVRVYADIDGKTRYRDGTGFGNGQAGINTPSSAYELALKEAETDAMKRALKSLGKQFGLSLYDKDVNIEKDYEMGHKSSTELELKIEEINSCKTLKQVKSAYNEYNGAYVKEVLKAVTLKNKELKAIKNENN